MIQKILIANRGEIACRIIWTCRLLGIQTVAVYSTADAHARHVQEADQAVLLGDAPAADSYLVINKVVDAAVSSGADAVHPGYGFLAENGEFAQACTDAGLIFIGPSAHTIEQMGNKRVAKQLAEKHDVPILTSYTGTDQSDEALVVGAAQIGYPVMVKAAAGGGGKGMRIVMIADDLVSSLASARREALQSFGSDELMLEKAILSPRHIEVQVFGDSHGNVVHLGERDCSLQRRHQKIIEESPAPNLDDELRTQICDTAVRLARAANYVNAGTVEFLLDGDAFYFLEMNTRIQVEHPVTEMVTGQDLVAWQIAVAEGQKLPLEQSEIGMSGHAIEARVYAEDAANGFLPVVGDILYWRPPHVDGDYFASSVRVDSGLHEQDHISVYYDPMIAKIIAYGADRHTAVRRLVQALRQTHSLGLTTNLSFLTTVLSQDEFLAGHVSTSFVERNITELNQSNAHQDGLGMLIAAAVARYRSDFRLTDGAIRYWRQTLHDPLRYAFLGEPVVEIWPAKQGIHIERLSVAGEEVFVQKVAENLSELALTINDRRTAVTMAHAGDVWWLSGNGVTKSFTAVTGQLTHAQLATDSGSLCAPMQGIVLDVLVGIGDVVEPNQPLVKLEAMKMEHTIKALNRGKVKEILCSIGDQVENQAILLLVE